MKLTRDSAVLPVAALTAVIGYLLTKSPPTHWGYLEWLQASAFLLAWVSGKLASSPLDHSDPLK